jgi:hypothetical protein
MKQAAEDADSRRFAGTVGAEEAEDFAGAGLKRDGIDGGEVAEFFGEIFDFD